MAQKVENKLSERDMIWGHMLCISGMGQTWHRAKGREDVNRKALAALFQSAGVDVLITSRSEEFLHNVSIVIGDTNVPIQTNYGSTYLALIKWITDTERLVVQLPYNKTFTKNHFKRVKGFVDAIVADVEVKTKQDEQKKIVENLVNPLRSFGRYFLDNCMPQYKEGDFFKDVDRGIVRVDSHDTISLILGYNFKLKHMNDSQFEEVLCFTFKPVTGVLPSYTLLEKRLTSKANYQGADPFTYFFEAGRYVNHLKKIVDIFTMEIKTNSEEGKAVRDMMNMVNNALKKES